MNPNRRRLLAPVALLWKQGPRRDAAIITALRPQVLSHITARFLETEQSTRHRACSGTTEQAAPRFIPRGHRADITGRLSSSRGHRATLALRPTHKRVAFYNLADPNTNPTSPTHHEGPL